MKRIFAGVGLLAIASIDNASFRNPWTVEDFNIAAPLPGYLFHVCEVGEDIAGYIVAEKRKTSIHIVQVAVAPEWRRARHNIGAGVGSKLVRDITKLLNNEHRRLVAYVCETNVGAQLFFRSLGFRWCSTERGFYVGDAEERLPDRDAYRMVYTQTQSPPQLPDNC